MADERDETTYQENADLSAKLPSTESTTPGATPDLAKSKLSDEDRVVDQHTSSPDVSSPADDSQTAVQSGGAMAGREADRAHALEHERASHRPTFLTLIGVFLTVLAFFARREQRSGSKSTPQIGRYDLAMLSLGSYRLARLLAFDQVTEPVRAPVTTTKPDGPVEPKDGPIRGPIGELISCPTCVGTWIAAGLTYALRLFPAPTRLFLAVICAAGIAEILDYGVNALDAVAKRASKDAGA